MKITVKAEGKEYGLGDLRELLASAAFADLPDNAKVRVRIAFGGGIKELTVEEQQ